MRLLWAYFRRWLYLLCYGMWRSQVAYAERGPDGVTEVMAIRQLTRFTYQPIKTFYKK